MIEASRRLIPVGLRQLIKFALVGGAGVLVNMTVAIVLNALNGGPENAQRIVAPIPGTDFNIRFTAVVWVAGFLVANLFNFQLNRTWTFRATDGVAGGAKGAWFSEFWRFFLVGSVAAVLGIVIKVAFTHPHSVVYLPAPWFYDTSGLWSREYWAQLLTIVVTLPINFLVNKFWTFRRPPRRGERSGERNGERRGERNGERRGERSGERRGETSPPGVPGASGQPAEKPVR